MDENGGGPGVGFEIGKRKARQINRSGEYPAGFVCDNKAPSDASAAAMSAKVVDRMLRFAIFVYESR